MRRLAALLILACGPVAAQELPYSDSHTLNCLQITSGGEAQRGCIGLSANACMETDVGSTTVGMGGCMERELMLWDRFLNDAYRARMAEAKRIDVETSDLGGSVPSQAIALRDMQRAWIIFRDAACDYERSQWGGGSGGGPATYACLLRKTAEQALALTPSR